MQAYDQSIQPKRADVNSMAWNGPSEVKGEALLKAAGACLAEFKLPTFHHLDEDSVFSASNSAINQRHPDPFSILSEIVSTNSGNRVTLSKVSSDEFLHGVQGQALYLKLQRGGESQLIVFSPNRDEPFRLEKGR